MASYHCRNVNGQGISISTDYFHEGIGNQVHHFAVSPEQESPEGKRNKPGVAIDRCCRNSHWESQQRDKNQIDSTLLHVVILHMHCTLYLSSTLHSDKACVRL